jgi:hypothetical protein
MSSPIIQNPDDRHRVRVTLDSLLARMSGHERKKVTDSRDVQRIKHYTDAVLDIRNLLIGPGGADQEQHPEHQGESTNAQGH